MKHRKWLIALVAVMLLMVFLPGCVSPFVAYRYPRAQTNTVWETKDGSVMFRVGAHETDPVYGSAETGDGPVEFRVSISRQVSVVEFFYAEDTNTGNDGESLKSFAFGQGQVVSKKEYRIEIVSADAVFAPGEILTFYRVDDLPRG